MRKLFLPILTLSLLILSGCGCKHEWTEATCTEPKNCSLCGETEGEALGHDKSSKEYVSATTAKRTKQIQCDRCSTVLETTKEDITSFIENKSFIISPSDLADRMDEKFDEIEGNTYMVQCSENAAGDLGIAIGDSSTRETIGAFVLLKSKGDENNIKYDDRYETGFFGALGMLYEKDSLARVLLSTVLTFDPSLSFDEAKTISKTILSDGSYTANGIHYIFTSYSGSYVMSINVE